MRRLVLLAAAALCAAAPAAHAAGGPLLPGCAPADVPGGDWPSYGGNYANTRTQSHEKSISVTDVPTLTSAWTFSSVSAGGNGDFTGTPAVADGCMYVASTRGWVFAVNADTGKLVWKAKVPYTGGVNSSVTVGERIVAAPKPAAAKKKAAKKSKSRAKKKKRRAKASAKKKKKKSKARKKKRRRAAAPAPVVKAGTVFVAVTRSQKGEGCPAGEKCQGPYVVALDQATGKPVYATSPIDDQPGADVYGSPVVYDNVLMIGVSGGSAELGDEADRYAFQGNMNFLDASTGRVLKKTWTIHPPKQPDDVFAGAGIWSTPAVDTDDKVAYVGTANPFKPQAEHKYANSVVKFDVDARSPRFGEIVGAYKGLVDEYTSAFEGMPCIDFTGNNPPYYPQGIGSCGDIDLDFGASPNLFTDASGRKLVGAGQKSGVYHVFDARTMKPVWKQIVGPPSSVGGIVGSTAMDGTAVYGPVTVPGYVWSLDAKAGDYRWLGPVSDGAHWGPPVSVANGVAYTVDFNGFLDAFDTRTGVLLAKRPLNLGGGGPLAVSWGGVSIARNTVYAAIGVLGLADGFVVAFKAGGPSDVAGDAGQTTVAPSDGGGGGGGGGGAGPSVVSGPGAASTGYATPVVPSSAGSQVSYVNLDVVQHDVVADDKGPDGNPLFRSKLIGLGESSPVEGTDKLKSGSYAFYCSVHPGMRGTLVVQ